jgi:hypothetical protein
MSIKDFKSDVNSTKNVIDIPNNQYDISISSSNNELRNHKSITGLNFKVPLFNDVITTNANSSSNNLLTTSGALNNRFNSIENEITNLGAISNDNTIFSVDASTGRKNISTIKSGEKVTGTNTTTASTTVIDCSDTSIFETVDKQIRIVNQNNNSKFHISSINTWTSNSSITINDPIDLTDFPNHTTVDLYTMDYATSFQIGDVIGTAPDDMMQSLLIENQNDKTIISVVPQNNEPTNKVLKISASQGNLQLLEIKSDVVNINEQLQCMDLHANTCHLSHSLTTDFATVNSDLTVNGTIINKTIYWSRYQDATLVNNPNPYLYTNRNLLSFTDGIVKTVHNGEMLIDNDDYLTNIPPGIYEVYADIMLKNNHVNCGSGVEMRISVLTGGVSETFISYTQYDRNNNNNGGAKITKIVRIVDINDKLAFSFSHCRDGSVKIINTEIKRISTL